MKICVVLYKFGTTEEIGQQLGSYSYFLRQLKELSQLGVEIIVVAPWLKWYQKGSNRAENIKVVRYWPKLASRSLRNLLLYKLINKIYIWRTGKIVTRAVKQENCDLVFVRQARETGYAVAKIKDKLNKPLVFQPITTWRWHFEDSKDGWFKRIIKDTKNQKQYAEILLKQFDHIVIYNKSMQAEYEALGAASDKFTIIPGAVDHELFKPLQNKQELRQQLKLPSEKKLILYIGRINFKEKGLDYLLQAFQKIKNHISDSHLVVIGPGSESQKEKLQQMIHNLGLENSVSYLGKQKYQDLPAYISACDVGVVPSVWFESSGRTSLDMLSCGLPTIVTNVGGLPEYSVDKKTGFVVEPKDTKALVDLMEKILNNDDLRSLMSQFARQHVLENYTFEKTTQQFVDFFNNINQ